MLHLYLFSTAILILTALLNLLTACLHPFRSLTAQDFLLLLILILFIFLMPELTSIFTLSPITLVNFGCISTCLWLKLFQKRSVKTLLMLNKLHFLLLFLLLSSLQDLAISGIFFTVFLFALGQCPLNVKKKVKSKIFKQRSRLHIRIFFSRTE